MFDVTGHPASVLWLDAVGKFARFRASMIHSVGTT